MTSALRCRGWMVALFCVSACAWASAQEGGEAKPSPPKRPGAEQWAKIRQINDRINRLVGDVGEANPDIKAMHETQQAKWRATNQKREELMASKPELKKLQEDLDAKRKQARQVADQLISKNPELAEMQKQMRELRQKFEEKIREVANSSPEIVAIQKEAEELQDKIQQGLKDDPDFQKVNDESDAAWNELVKKAAEKSPALAKVLEERDALRKSAAPEPPARPKEAEQPEKK